MTALIRYLSLIIFINFIISAVLCNPQKDNTYSIYYGTWTVKQYKFGNAVSVFDDAQALKYINKQVLFRSNEVTVFGDKCSLPLYVFIGEKNSQDYLYKNCNETDFSVIPTAKILIIEVRCQNSPEYRNTDSLNFNFEFILLNEKSMFIPINGAYLYLEKEMLMSRELFSKEFNGVGSFKQRIDLSSCDTEIKIEYRFFNVADRIIIEDAVGNTLLSTEMEATSVTKTLITNAHLSGSEQCYFFLKVESSKEEKSKWEVKVILSEYR